MSQKKTLFAVVSSLMAVPLGCTNQPPVKRNASPELMWDYKLHGEDYWNEHYPNCKNGDVQSPINIATETVTVASKQPGFGRDDLLDYRPEPAHVSVKNNGHTINFRYQGNTVIHYPDDAPENTYRLQSFHFHHESENAIDGVHAPLEVHFVHATAQKPPKLLVVAALLDEKGQQDKLVDYFKLADATKTSAGTPPIPFDPSILLPENQDYYHYRGSLTTPPCTEGVAWFVFKDRGHVSKEDVRYFAETDYPANFRLTKPLNGRRVLDYQ